MQSIKSAIPEKFNLMYYQNGQLRQTVNDSHVTFSIIAKPGAKFSQTGIDRYQARNLAPTIVLRYTRGSKDCSMLTLIMTNYSSCFTNRFY